MWVDRRDDVYYFSELSARIEVAAVQLIRIADDKDVADSPIRNIERAMRTSMQIAENSVLAR